MDEIMMQLILEDFANLDTNYERDIPDCIDEDDFYDKLYGRVDIKLKEWIKNTWSADALRRVETEIINKEVALLIEEMTGEENTP